MSDDGAVGLPVMGIVGSRDGRSDGISDGKDDGGSEGAEVDGTDDDEGLIDGGSDTEGVLKSVNPGVKGRLAESTGAGEGGNVSSGASPGRWHCEGQTISAAVSFSRSTENVQLLGAPPLTMGSLVIVLLTSKAPRAACRISHEISSAQAPPSMVALKHRPC